MHRRKLRVIHAKTNGLCWYCGSALEPLGDWEVEHQIPRSQGGGDSLENLVPACRQCNALKGRRTVEEYRHSLKLKLENAITEAYEMAGELEARVGLDYDPDTPGNQTPPGWLCHIQWLLYDAGTQTVNAPFQFHAERQGVDTEPPPVVQESGTIS